VQPRGRSFFEFPAHSNSGSTGMQLLHLTLTST
jgi:hypothetical protein